jgi:Metallopeptidase toxin 3
MFFDQTTAQTFPNCVSFVRSELNPTRLQATKPKTFAAFTRACGFIDNNRSLEPKTLSKLINAALNIADGPWIVVKAGFVHRPNASDKLCALTVDKIGGFDINQVWISSLVTNPYEFCVTPADKAKNALQLEKTLLHEMVHWVRGQAGLLDNIYAAGITTFEAGEVFEIWAYGNISCVDTDIAEAQSSIF